MSTQFHVLSIENGMHPLNQLYEMNDEGGDLLDFARIEEDMLSLTELDQYSEYFMVNS